MGSVQKVLSEVGIFEAIKSIVVFGDGRARSESGMFLTLYVVTKPKAQSAIEPLLRLTAIR